MSGSRPVCSMRSKLRPVPATTASSASIWNTWHSTGRSTKHPAVVRAPAKVLLTERNSGYKWSVAVDGAGIPIGYAIDGANRNDMTLLEPTLDAVAANGLLDDVELLSLDRGYDYPIIRVRLAGYGLGELDIQKRGTKPPPGTPHRLTLGLRWIVEALNSWWSNNGQLRRSTDRKNSHRLAALSLATTVLMTCHLIDYRDRWNPTPTPIR
jgi:hypothetical protein